MSQPPPHSVVVVVKELQSDVSPPFKVIDFSGALAHVAGLPKLVTS
jgi:hypothetical protein